MWSAASPNRDFRESKWTSTQVQPSNTITIKVPNPTSGRQALFADLEYEIDGIPYHLTTTFFEPGANTVGREAAVRKRAFHAFYLPDTP